MKCRQSRQGMLGEGLVDPFDCTEVPNIAGSFKCNKEWKETIKGSGIRIHLPLSISTAYILVKIIIVPCLLPTREDTISQSPLQSELSHCEWVLATVVYAEMFRSLPGQVIKPLSKYPHPFFLCIKDSSVKIWMEPGCSSYHLRVA